MIACRHHAIEAKWDPDHMQGLVFANVKRFPHDTIDGETVIIDAESGHLFLLTGIGPWLWHRLAVGASFQELADELSGHYGMESVEPTLAFLNSLAEQDLLTTEPTATLAGGDLPSLSDVFALPVLEKYDDIAEIIAMDPIHDIIPSKGWPHAPTEDPAS
jgi:hypothetical protein